MSGIEWTGITWNPVTGCTPVSAGCSNCWARRMARRLAGRYGYPADEPFRVTIHRDRFLEPFTWRRPRTVFVCSMGDFFHPEVPDEVIAKLLSVMEQNPRHTFQVLTKRPRSMRFVLGSPATLRADGTPWPDSPAPNIQVGVSAEDQASFDFRVQTLFEVPAAVRYVSLEPLLGPVTLGAAARDDRLSWVIVGGESGPRARPMHPSWARRVRDECADAGIPFFFKQWGEWGRERDVKEHIMLGYRAPGSLFGSLRGGTVTEYIDGEGRRRSTNELHTLVLPEDWELMARVGKRKAGRLLDGVVHDAMPENEGRPVIGAPKG